MIYWTDVNQNIIHPTNFNMDT